MVATTLSVTAIENGLVIDHIRRGRAAAILSVFRLSEQGTKVTVGLNLQSISLTCKDIIKIEGKAISNDLAHGIAVFAPEATINVIKDFKVVDKISVHTPEHIAKVLICPNPRCITNHEPDPSLFHVEQQSQKTKLCCHYCEKIYDLDAITAFNPE